MKLFSLIALTLAILYAVTPAVAQSRSKTIIFVRHAEKVDSSADPDLSAEGKERAQRLVKVLGKYKPGAFYSTNFKRTRDTITPLAQKRKKTIEIYDARKTQELYDAIMKSDTKRFLVAGHSNSSPGLVNLFGKKDLFKNLDESEFGVIWIVRIKDGQVRKTEILQY